MILDIFNEYKDRLFKREAPTPEHESYYSRLDVDQFFNYLNNLWDPSELIKKIGGYHNLPLLYKDDEIYSAWDKRQAALADTKLTIVGKSNEAVKFFEEQLMPHEFQLKSDFQWAVPYGYSVEQIIYDPDRSCKVMGFQREEFWRFEPMPDLFHVRLVNTSQPGLINKLMPYGKWVLTSNRGTYFNPMGDPMFERLIQPWIFKCTGWDLWIDFAKRFANGFLHGKVDGSQDEIIEYRKTLEKAVKSSIIVTNPSAELTLTQASRDSSLYKDLDDKTVQKIQRVVLGETLTSAMQERGNSGAASVHDQVRWEKIMYDIRLVEKSFNETIRQIAYVCEMDEGEIPEAKLIIDAGLNKELADRDAVLSGQIKFSKKYYIDNYGFDEDDFEIQETPQPTFFNQKKKSLYLSPDDVKEYLGIDESCEVCDKPHPRKAQLSPNVRRKDRRQLKEKEDTVSFLTRNGSEPINIDDLTAAILNSKNEKDLDKNLNALFGMDDASDVDLLTQTLYYAATKGALLGNPERLDNEEE